MGKFGAKGKKLSATNQRSLVRTEKVNIPSQKKRGRPQKSLKDGIDEDEVPKMEDEDSEDTNSVPNKDVKNTDGKKLKENNAQVETVEEENGNVTKTVEEENGNVTKSSTEVSQNPNGLRQNRNRRKSKPRRAAEAVVECN